MKLIEKLPYFYYENKEVNSIQSSLDIERENLEKNVIDLLNQLFINTSTELGVQLWEEFFNIQSDNGLSLEIRKANILAKVKGNNVATIDNLYKLCKSFTGGDVDIIEDFSSYKFTISFVAGGISDTKQLISKIEEVKPAHLAYEIIIALSNYMKMITSKKVLRQIYKKCGTVKVALNLKNTKSEVIASDN